MSTPQSVINICSGVKLNSRYEHSIYFGSAAAQRNYFAGKVVKTLSAYSYLRKTWPLKVEGTMEEAKTWNYLFFHNSMSGKVYYYFINTVEYVNDNTVELGLELDVIQTYLFNFEILPSFVERHHTLTDEVGEHTVDEGLELGELYDNAMYNLQPGSMCIMIMSTINPGATTKEAAEIPALPYRYNGVFSGVKIWAVDGSRWADWGEQLDQLDEWGKADSIVAMWMYPKNLVMLGGEDRWDNGELVHAVEGAVGFADEVETSFPAYTYDMNGYTPKNGKLHTYPYQFMYVTNNQGNSAAFHYERFLAGQPRFRLSGALTPDGGVRMTPVSYNGLFYNYKEGLTLGGYPTCAWDSDIYKMWLAQTQNTRYNDTLVNVGKMGVGLATALLSGGIGAAGGLAMAGSGLVGIMNQVGTEKDKAIEPPQAKGNFSTSVNITDGKMEFTIYERCVNAERARIIDDYFTMYGYKINRVYAPSLCNREHFTYVKTIGCHIRANVCNEDTVKIESIFDNGITFWTNGDNIADYSLDNRA